MTSPFAFFALVAGPETAADSGGAKAPCETHRLLVSSDVQQALSTEFERQAAELTDPGRKRVRYDPGYKLEPREVFVVDATLAPQEMIGRAGPKTLALPASLLAAVRNPQAAEIVDADVLRDGRLRSVCAARGAEGDLVLIFQLFQQGQVIRRGNWRYLHILDDTRTFTSLGGDCLALANSAAAVYREGQVFFASEATVRRFLDLGPLFHAATDRELKRFFKHGDLWAPLNLADILAQADDGMRHKIAEIEFRQNLAGLGPRDIQSVAKNHGIQVKLDASGRLVAPQEKRDLKTLLRFLADDLLESPLTHWWYWSNSKRRASRASLRAAARRSRLQTVRQPSPEPRGVPAHVRSRVAAARSKPAPRERLGVTRSVTTHVH